MVKWLYQQLDFAQSFEDNVSKPEKYGEILDFNQKEFADDLGLDADAMGLPDLGKIYVPDQCKSRDTNEEREIIIRI